MSWPVLRQSKLKEKPPVVLNLAVKRTATDTSPRGRAGLRIREWVCSDCGTEM